MFQLTTFDKIQRCPNAAVVSRNKQKKISLKSKHAFRINEIVPVGNTQVFDKDF